MGISGPRAFALGYDGVAPPAQENSKLIKNLQSARQRSIAAASTGKLVRISFPPVQSLSGIVPRLAANCLTALRIHPAPRTISSTSPVCRGLVSFAPFRALLLGHEGLRQRPRG